MKLFIFLLFVVGTVLAGIPATGEFGPFLIGLGFVFAIFYANEKTRQNDVEDAAESIAIAVQKINKETNYRK